MENHHMPTPGCCCNKTEEPLVAQQIPAKEPVVSGAKKTVRAIPSVLLSVLIAFFPKCPVCWAVYMSMFGSLGLAQLPYMGWLLPVLMGFLGLHLFMMYKKVPKNGYLPFLLSLTGASIMLFARIFFPLEKWLLLTAMSFIISGSLLNSFSNVRLQFFNHTQNNN